MHDILKDDCNSLEKPKILTHIIDGFVIEESLTPFPSAVTSLTCDQINSIHKRQQELLAQDYQSDNTDELDFSNHNEKSTQDEEHSGTCEFCGVTGPRNSFLSPSRRFCTLSCARRFATSHSKRHRESKQIQNSRLQRVHKKPYTPKLVIRQKPGCNGDHFIKLNRNPSPPNSVSDSSFSDLLESASSDTESLFSFESSPSPEPKMPSAGNVPLQPLHWTVDDVWNYIRSLSDSWQYADEFRSQEIDGSALLLLHEEHLISSMNLPLGPALKLCAHIEHLRLQESL